MAMAKVSSMWLRHADGAVRSPISGQLIGKIPEWLHGVLYRNGAGIKEIGPDKYDHLFDGLACVHKFTINGADGGSATYQSRFLESNQYRSNMAAGRIQESAFGTLGRHDLCRSLFGRLMSTYRDLTGSGLTKRPGSDNCVVNVGYVGRRLYAMTEGLMVWRLNEEDLSAEKQVDLSKVVAVDSATAHPHVMPDGTVYNVGNSFSGPKGPQVTFLEFPAKGNGEEGRIVGRLPHRWPLEPSYFHSFGITQQYLVIVQQPLVIRVKKMLTLKLKRRPITDAIKVKEGEKTTIRLLDRVTGEVHPVEYTADPFFAFHHVNAYEQDGHVVVDVCCIQPSKLSMIDSVFRKMLSSEERSLKSRMQRYVLPLASPARQNSSSPDANLVTLPSTRAKAVLSTDSTVHCSPETLSPPDIRTVDLPRINYAYNGKPYRYAYACQLAGAAANAEALLKIDVQTGGCVSWSDPEWSPSEPVFVARPGGDAEDAGVVLASLLHVREPRVTALLVLDAASMQEVARAEFKTEVTVPKDFHGLFAGGGDAIHGY